jgi:hypothetical protein
VIRTAYPSTLTGYPTRSVSLRACRSRRVVACTPHLTGWSLFPAYPPFRYTVLP